MTPAGEDTRSYGRARPFGDDPSLIGLPARYQVKQELGRGGAGAVYRVYDRAAGHEVALKTLHGVSPEHRLRLKSEFRAVSHIVHPNLVDLHDLVMEEHICFFTMEFVNGSDFATHVGRRQPAGEDDDPWHARFQDVARQLALALNALHQGGKLHRDVKPSNVLVTDAGRVVLVDFGLAVAARRETSDSEVIVGTPLYMAPEQFAGRPLGPAADWYAFGVTLYEAVSGKMPSRFDLYGAAAGTRSKSLRDRGVKVRPELDQLITALLSTDPAARPTGPEILACLGGRSQSELSRPSVLPPQVEPLLIGRSAELAFLKRAFESLDSGAPGVIRVLGPSGIGKTSIRRGIFDALGGSPGHLLLKSRCHPRESVVFNAVDGLIDELATELPECLDEEQRTLPEAQHSALMQVFPVLATALIAESPASNFYTDDREKRHVAFVALCEVLKRISRRFKILLWLDDVQWGDQDSGTLLRDLLRLHDRPPMLLVLSYRAEDESASPCLRVLRDDAELWSTTVPLRIRPLDDAESSQLVETLAGSAPFAFDPARREALIRSAAGSPFLLGELARYISIYGPRHAAREGDGRVVGFDDILALRTRDLPPDCRRVLEVLAVAGSPLEQSVTLAAAGVASESRGLVTSLERLSIVRTTDVKTQRIEFYHDKLREEVISQLGEPVRAEHHRAIAHALLAMATPNPLTAIDHFESAGDVESVRRYVVAAANHALKLLAFERAARLYERALALEPGEVALHELHRRLGSSLGSAGRGREAAVAYSRAAELLREDPDARPEEIQQLQQRAAEQFIQSGHFQRGVEIIRSVLSDLGVAFPGSRKQALVMAAGLRLASFVRGFRAGVRRSPPDELELRRFDTLWAATAHLAMIDYALSSYTTARCARDAVTLGEPSRMSRAFSMEAAFSSTLPQRLFQKRARKLLKMAEEHALRGDDAEHDSIFTVGARAIISFYGGSFRDAWKLADRALERLHAHSPARTWEYAPWHMWSLIGLAVNGEIAELVRRARASREEAALRDDRYIEQNISLGPPTVAWLAADLVEEAAERAERAIGWAPAAYTAQHYQHYVTMVDYDLYRGDGLSAWERTVLTWPSHTSERFTLLTFVRDELLRSRGRSALAAALVLRKTGRRRTKSGHTQKQLLAIARKAAFEMNRHDHDFARGFALLLASGLARAKGKTVKTVALLQSAVVVFDRADMRLYREIARYCVGHLQPSPVGQQERDRAERWLSEQGVVNPRKVAASLAPGVL